MRRIVGWALVLILIAAGACAAWLAFSIARPFKGYTEPERFVEVRRGRALRRLENAWSMQA